MTGQIEPQAEVLVAVRAGKARPSRPPSSVRRLLAPLAATDAQRRCGMWVGFVGVVAQLVGMSWDAVLHALDPGLAARESIFSLTNPSHLLLAGGLALTVLGVLWGLYASWASGPTRLRRVVPTLATALLVVFSIGTAGIAQATGNVLGQHAHAHEKVQVRVDADSLVEANPLVVPYLQIVREQGTEQALAELNRAAARDESIMAWAHDLAHSVGVFSYFHYGDAGQAFGRCTPIFQSGCYHGVMQGFFADNPDVRPEDVADLCEATLSTGATGMIRSQCLHGLGHGVTSSLGHDVFRALTYCDALATDYDRAACYKGAFMENVVFSTVHLLAQPGGGSQHDHGHDTVAHQTHIIPESPLYPCNTVAERYQVACYEYVTTVALAFNGGDFADAARTCDGAPRQWIGACYKSLGRDVGGRTLRDDQRALELCRVGDPQYRGDCYAGVVKALIDFIDLDWQTDDAFAFCAQVEVEAKERCYREIGEQVKNLFNDDASRAAECAKTEAAYVEICRAAEVVPD